MMPGQSKRDFPTQGELEDGLPLELRIFVPSTRDVNVKLSKTAFQKRIQETVTFFTRLFGGSTKFAGVGSYTTQRGKRVVSENVAVVEVFTNSATWNKHDLEVKKWLLEKKQNWGQESMGLDFDGDLVFV